ncbi:MAG: haloalkane dehalogenase [Bacteroidia bacterium]|jgi:haloalkane dehalogenase
MMRLVVVLTLTLFSAVVSANEVAPGIYRTPDARFENLDDYPFAPNYMQIGKYRVHYLDEGPADATPILLLHGEPTWSYLYRKMIPVLTAAGYRVIAPDLVGFGKSDKAANTSDYSYQMQVDSMLELVQKLNLQDVTFFGQDWGGLIGLRVVTAQPERFSSVVVSNTGMPDAEGIVGMLGYSLFRLAVWWEGEVTLNELREDVSFMRWVAYSQSVDDLPVGELMQFMGVDDTVVQAYEAPFPDRRYKAAVHVMPYLVPSQLQENAAAWKVFEKWKKPFLVAFSDSDPITAGGDKVFLDRVPTAQNFPIAGAGHFVQEDAGVELARLILRFLAGETLQQSSGNYRAVEP